MTEFRLNTLRQIPSDIEKSIVLIGMPGIAGVGKLCISSLISSLNAEKVAEIFCSDFPPHVLVEKDGILYVPRTTIYHRRLEDGGTKDLFFITGDYQPTTSIGVYEFADYIAEKCAELFKAEMIISTAAFVRENLPEIPHVFISSTSQKTLESFIEADKAELFKNGTVTGANGIIPAIAAVLYDMVGVCCLGETAPVLQSDPRAAKAIVEVVNQTLHISPDIASLTLVLDDLIEESEPIFREAKNQLEMNKMRDQSRSQPYIS
ncbi:MAG: PAC2 family protein [Candidatus Lokiarchaeota archaeon]|nr:PAC2 family protein [Candidatus Lokiarchaeota archaeon]